MQGLALGVVALLPRHLCHLRQRVGDIVRARAGGLAELKRAGQERLRLIEEPELPVDTADGVHEPALDGGLAGQTALDPRRTPIQQLARRDRAAPRLARVGHLEDADEERRHFPGGIAFLLREVALAGHARRLHRHEHREGDQHQHEQAGDGDFPAVARDEPPRPVGPCGRARMNRPPVEEARHVVDQRFHGSVAPLPILVQRRADDDVEILVDACHDRAGARGIGVAHHPLDLPGAQRRERVRASPRGELEEQHAKGVDVGGRGDGLAAHLLGRGVVGRQHPHARHRPRRQLGVVGIEQLGDAEVQELGCAVRRHDDVRGLDVAVDDQVAMCVTHGFADHEEEPQPFLEREVLIARVRVDRPSLDVLHHQVGPSIARGPAVDESRDVRVLQRGEDLPLGPEPPDTLLVEQAAHDLDGHALLEGAIGALTQVDRSHAALADLRDDAVRAQSLVDGSGRGGRHGADGLVHRLLQLAGIAGVGLQHREHERRHGLVIGGRADHGGALRRRLRRGVLEQRLHAPPAFGSHVRWRRSGPARL